MDNYVIKQKFPGDILVATFGNMCWFLIRLNAETCKLRHELNFLSKVENKGRFLLRIMCEEYALPVVLK